MKLPPIVRDMGREAIVVLGGAILAALLLRQAPMLKHWIKSSWD